MRAISLSLVLLAVTTVCARADDVAACRARSVEISRQAEAFSGEAKIKRLIDADIKRARKEAAEGDADECTEALDHAAKLLAGNA